MKILKWSVVVGLLLSASQTNASTVNSTHIFQIVPANNGIIHIYVDATRTGLPACAAANNNVFSVDATTPAGQAMMAALYLAYGSNSIVDVVGASSCDGASNAVEYIAWAVIRRA